MALCTCVLFKSAFFVPVFCLGLAWLLLLAWHGCCCCWLCMAAAAAVAAGFCCALAAAACFQYCIPPHSCYPASGSACTAVGGTGRAGRQFANTCCGQPIEDAICAHPPCADDRSQMHLLACAFAATACAVHCGQFFLCMPAPCCATGGGPYITPPHPLDARAVCIKHECKNPRLCAAPYASLCACASALGVRCCQHCSSVWCSCERPPRCSSVLVFQCSCCVRRHGG